MTHPALLGTLNNLYEMQAQLLESTSPEVAQQQQHPELGSLNWLFGRGVYLELYWLREILQGDHDLSQRVEKLFRPGALPLQEQCAQLPPTDHLLNWGAEIRDEHLRRLANPATLPQHPLLENERLQWFLAQEQAKLYEAMLLAINQRNLNTHQAQHQVVTPLHPASPEWETRELSQGHYRIGARDDPRAYDNELPPQAVELSSYRIALNPVSNAQYLGFMQARGYTSPDLWTQAGQIWLKGSPQHHPEYWCQDSQGNWYGMGINGPTDLPANEPVIGINQHEAQAYANWVSGQSGKFTGAILQHEYQWEMAARTGVIRNTGRAWEWCNNPFHPYAEFVPFPDDEVSSKDFDGRHYVLRGGSIHTQRVLRRASLRHRAFPEQRIQLSGLRLVFPALHKWT